MRPELYFGTWMDPDRLRGVPLEFLAEHNGEGRHRHHSRAVPRFLRSAQRFHHSPLLGAAATPEHIERIANAKEKLYRISPLPGVGHWLHERHKIVRTEFHGEPGTVAPGMLGWERRDPQPTSPKGALRTPGRSCGA